jgi:predicted small secreted protein
MKIFVALVLAASMAACSTVSGIGKDISSGAEWSKEKIGKAL